MEDKMKNNSMKLFKQLLLILAMVAVILGLGFSHEAQAAKRQQLNSIARIHAEYNVNAPVRNGRICNDYFLNNILKLKNVYAVNASGKRLKNVTVTVKEYKTFLRSSKNKPIYITLQAGNKTKRICLSNVKQVTNVTATRVNIQLPENQYLTKKMIAKIRFRTTWSNGHVTKIYKGAKCTDIGKKITGKYFTVHFKIGSKTATIKLPVKKHKLHVWKAWYSKNNKLEERMCSICGLKQTRAHFWNTCTYKDTLHDVRKCSSCGLKQTQTHKWGAWSSKNDNEEQRQCLNCNVKVTQPHQWHKWTSKNDNECERDCSHCGLQQTKFHKWDSWTSIDEYEEQRECADCGFISTQLHLWDSWTYIDEQECEHECAHCGLKITQSHNWSSWTCKDELEDQKQCSDCDFIVTNPHKWDSWEPIDENEEQKECSLCGLQVTQLHEWNSWISNDNNEHQKTCPNCDLIIAASHRWSDYDFKNLQEDQRNCIDCGLITTQPHQWSSWSYKDSREDQKECLVCNFVVTQPHEFVCNSHVKDNNNGSHTVYKDFSCSVCNSAHYTNSYPESHTYNVTNEEFTDNTDGTHTKDTTNSCSCGNTYVDTQIEDCTYSDWQYIGNNIDAQYCVDCDGSQTREHQHAEQPPEESLNFVFLSSNHDGTEKWQATYICSICNEEVPVYKNVDCTYETTYSQTGVNDVHMVNLDCMVCGYHTDYEGTCIPIGELKLIKIYSQIYEYYDCELCGDQCQRKYHNEHQFGNWEYRDSQTHIRYCMCIEGREIENHNYVYDPVTLTISCAACGDSRAVPEHDHGYGTHDEMNLMDLISNPAYTTGEILSNSQIANPNPSPTDYCSRYEFRCKTCGAMYYIHFAHKFVDGVCTRTGYCGGIQQSSGIASESSHECDITNEEVYSKPEEWFPNINIPFINLM